MNNVLRFVLLAVFLNSWCYGEEFFSPLYQYQKVYRAINDSDSSCQVSGIQKGKVPVMRGSIMKSTRQKLTDAVIRPQIGLPGIVDDHPPLAFRQQCLDVRNRYHRAMMYWELIAKQLECYVKRMENNCSPCTSCMTNVENLYKKMQVVYPKKLDERNLTLKYRWPVRNMKNGVLQSIKVGERILSGFSEDVLPEHFKYIVDAGFIGLDYEISLRELCLEKIAAEMLVVSKTGKERTFTTSYTF